MNKLWESMPSAEFVSMVSNVRFLGNQRIKTQHFTGGGRFIRTGENEITGYHQMRVAHQKYKDDDLTEVLYTGHAHGKATIRYRKVEGVWKFAGLEPDIRWGENDYDKIFRED
jgi:scytalone dehydratase